MQDKNLSLVKFFKLGFINVSKVFAKSKTILRPIFFGALLVLAFAPFHLPGAVFISLGLFYIYLQKQNKVFLQGFYYGLGFFGAGISWICISIHNYGHFNYFITFFITLLLVIYLSFFTAVFAYIFTKLNKKQNNLTAAFKFASLWIIFEYFRSYLFTGFPWLLIGYTQVDTPLKYLFPIIGVYGVGFVTSFTACLLALSFHHKKQKKAKFYLIISVLLILMPISLINCTWVQIDKKKLSVAVVQANFSINDKWDETLFLQSLKSYDQYINQAFGHDLIVLPETALPLPQNYLVDYLNMLSSKAKINNAAIVTGIPKINPIANNYYNALITLGSAEGEYLKRHLVPFGEYIPKPFSFLKKLPALNFSDLEPGEFKQALIKIHDIDAATLICYESAYNDLLIKQMPAGKFIISINDDGWFGHSLAIYQHIQIAQTRSLETGRFQIVANNSGLSAIINNWGEIINILPAFEAGILTSYLNPVNGITPWLLFGNIPILLVCFLIIIPPLIQKTTNNLLLMRKTIAARAKRGYS